MVNLTKIQTETTWGDVSRIINANNQQIQNEFEKVIEKNLGYYIDYQSLITIHPKGRVGDIAYVGTTSPFVIYTWNGSSWIDSGQTGGSGDVDLSNFLPKSGGTISGNLEIMGDTVVKGLTVSNIVVEGKTDKEVLLGNGTTLNVDELVNLKTSNTSDENEYSEVF